MPWKPINRCARASISTWRRTRAIVGAVRRACDGFGVLDERTLAAHCVHVTAAEMDALQRRRVNVVHNPQSNCNNAVGIGQSCWNLCRRGVLVGLGSDGYSPRMWDEFKTAFHVQKLRDARPARGLRARLTPPLS